MTGADSVVSSDRRAAFAKRFAERRAGYPRRCPFDFCWALFSRPGHQRFRPSAECRQRVELYSAKPKAPVILKEYCPGRNSWLLCLARDRRPFASGGRVPENDANAPKTGDNIRCFVRRPCQLMLSRRSREAARKSKCAIRRSATASSFGRHQSARQDRLGIKVVDTDCRFTHPRGTLSVDADVFRW